MSGPSGFKMLDLEKFFNWVSLPLMFYPDMFPLRSTRRCATLWHFQKSVSIGSWTLTGQVERQKLNDTTSPNTYMTNWYVLLQANTFFCPPVN